MYLYHLSFKKLIITNATFLKGTISVIAGDIDTYIEIFLVYLLSSLITLMFFSFTVTMIVVIIECLILAIVLHASLNWALIERYHKS